MTEQPQPTQTKQDHFYHKPLAMVIINDEEVKCTFFELKVDAVNNTFNCVVFDGASKLEPMSSMTRWKIKLGHFMAKGKGATVLGSTLYFCMAPTLSPETVVAIPCQCFEMKHGVSPDDIITIYNPVVAA